MSAVYRASTLKRERRTKERLEQLDAQIIAVLKEDQPSRQQPGEPCQYVQAMPFHQDHGRPVRQTGAHGLR